mgnify:CR=1 FL=1
MDTREKKLRLSAIYADMERMILRGGFVVNFDNVFFVGYLKDALSADMVYSKSQKYGLEIEVISLDEAHFVGSKERASALLYELGGRIGKTEYCFNEQKSQELWFWENPAKKPIDLEDAINAVFLVN